MDQCPGARARGELRAVSETWDLRGLGQCVFPSHNLAVVSFFFLGGGVELPSFQHLAFLFLLFVSWGQTYELSVSVAIRPLA